MKIYLLNWPQLQKRGQHHSPVGILLDEHDPLNFPRDDQGTMELFGNIITSTFLKVNNLEFLDRLRKIWTY